MTKKTNKSNQSFADLLPNLPSNNSGTEYISITNEIEVKVSPEFVDKQVSSAGNLFVWMYHVEIKNKASESYKLINRHWKIIDEKGGVQEVDGEGVVGETPSISPNESFQYSSGIHLRYPSGIMTGHFQIQKNKHLLLYFF